MRLARFLVVSILAVGAVLPLGIAAAQYPQPLGNCVATPPASITPNSTLTFVVTVLTDKGAPAAGVTGTVKVTGEGASVVTPTFITGADGKANIQVKTGASGQVNVAVTCGSLSTSSVVTVITPATVIPKPPVTGDGTAVAGDGGFSLLMLLGGVAAVGAAGTAAATVAVRRRK